MTQPENKGLWAWLFPGQGSQKIGMGRRLLEHSGAARRVFDEASDAVGMDLVRLCLEGPSETLTATENAQPAIVTCSVACLALLQERGIEPAAVAGHSVGEFSALVAAGSLPLAAAVRAVRKRGQLMASVTAPGKMLAVMGLEGARVSELCRDAAKHGVIAVAIHNSPQQFVLSGSLTALEQFKELALVAGAKECVLLEVSHAFHSPLMAQVQEEWQAVVASLQLRMPKYPVVLNTTAMTVKTLVCIRRSLLEQITSPVLWMQCVQSLVNRGITHVLEVGDSKVVSSLARRTAPSLQAMTLQDPAAVDGLGEDWNSSIPKNS
ncbi:ACP S-malonyltransferase [Stigmatella sp. ncwal1]|uniref:Malonyl CoA-acyl carrier protein transacylase n=1 Tax=Stigmatella ashevillensis TaxID=2995309 RepID=A0ABT5DJN1_9BACT|nr:ACP S-malonyltransferase [Stigmatella ashevillena]MDC0713338.1 ACP S-malonyltransferase [Stigmatella ashevillena]